MANYTVDIAVAIKNAEKLGKFNKQIKDLSLNIQGANTFLEAFAKGAKLAVAGNEGLARSVNNLQKNLNLTSTNLKNVALGTKEATLAAFQFVKAQEQLNKGLQEELALIKEVEKGRRFTRFAKAGIRETRNAYSSPIGPGQASSVLGGQSAPVAGKIERTLALRRDEIKLQEALLSLELKSAAVQNKKLQIRGELNRQTATAVNNARFAGQSSPLTSPVFPGYGGPIGPGQASGLFSGGAFRERLMSNLDSSQASRQASAFNIRPGTQYERPIGPAFSANLKSQLRHQKKIDKNTGKTAQILSTQAGIANFGATGQTQYSAPIGPSEASFMQKRGIGKGANPRGIFASQGGRTARAKGALQSGLIGGGFPLLFGQGAAGAIAGGIGGALGGALSPGFGFAGSIVATAVTQELQKIVEFRKQVSDLNIEMRSMGISANIGSTQINKLGKSLGVTKEEAIKVLEQFKRFGEASVGLAKFFGGDFALFSGFAQADDVSSTLNAIQQASKDLTIQDQIRVTNLLNQKGAEAAINELIDMRRKKVIKLKQEEQKVRQFDPANPTGQGNINQIINNRKELDKLNVESDESIQNLFQIKEGFTELKFATEEAGFSVVSEVERINKELRKLNNTQFQTVELSRTIGSSFQESFKGIVKGTMSVGDAFRNMFMRIADHFLDMAAQMAAAQIQKGFLGMFGNLLNPFSFGSSFASFGSVGAGTSSMFVGSASASAFLADGGTARAGRSYIVGERGPEMFTPGVTGTVTPNESLGGSTNIVVNVDASGSSVEGDEENGRELGRMISVAIQSELIKQKRPGGLLT